MKGINLYQSEFRPPAIVLPGALILRLAAAFTILLLLIHAWQRWDLARLQTQESTLAVQARQAQVRAEAVKAAARPANPALIKEAESWERRHEALQRAQVALEEGSAGSEKGFSSAFRALAQAAVPGAWLVGADLLGQDREMNLKGRALTGEDAARLVSSLQRQPRFAGLRFAGIEMDSPPETAKPASDPRATPRHLEFELKARLPEVVPHAAAAAKAGDAPVGHAAEPPLAAALGPSQPNMPLPPGLAQLPIPRDAPK